MRLQEEDRTADAHPLANSYPLMGGADFDRLAADIAENGIRNVLWKYQGKILDGRNRYRAAAAAGVTEVPFKEFVGTEDEARRFVDSQNLYRRHLTTEFRQAWVAMLRDQGLSTRAIADVVGINQATVVRDLKSGDANASPETGAKAGPAPCTTTPAPATTCSATSPAAPAPSASPPPKVKGLDGKRCATHFEEGGNSF